MTEQTFATVRLMHVGIGILIHLAIMFMVVRKDRRPLAVAYSLDLLASAFYRGTAGYLFYHTTTTGTFELFGISSAWYYGWSDIISVYPMVGLFVLLILLFTRKHYDGGVSNIKSALTTVQVLRKHPNYEQLDETFRNQVDLAEDVLGNVAADFVLTKQLHDMKADLKV